MSRSTLGNAMHRRLCHFSGHVQGVGFRYTIQNLAMQYNVQGYVRNLPDGRVELAVEGTDDEMDALLEEVNRKMQCFVRSMHQETYPATGEFQQFEIRR